MKRQSKFNVSKVKTDRTFDGIIFDSVLELRYYRDVIVPGLESGEIISCERQKRYVLQPRFQYIAKFVPAIEYKADFVVRYRDGAECVIDIKGCPDDVAKLKRKMFWYKYPDISYVWLGYSEPDGGWVSYEEIRAGRKRRKAMKQKKEQEQTK